MMNDQTARAQGSPAGWGPPGTAAALFAAGLAFDGVGFSHGRKAILQDITFKLNPGEIICLLGPSGCGKSTLLRLASGIERPGQGCIAMDGLMLAGNGIFVPPERRAIGLVFQDFALFPHLTVLENVLFGLKKLDRASASAQADNALKRVGMTSFANRFPGSLSGGEQQRIALARAIATRPSVLLMDEPFSSLDPQLRSSVRAETLAILKETRASCIIVTHDPEEAIGMADRLLLMRAGRLIQSGSPREIIEAPVDIEAARFLGNFNELTCDVSGGVATTPFGPVKLLAPAATLQRAQLLIRPQGLHPAAQGLEGLVSAARYEGEFTFLRVLFDGFEGPFWSRVATPDAPAAGKPQHFRIDPAQVLAFPPQG